MRSIRITAIALPAVAILAASAGLGCVSVPAGTSLEAATPARVSVARGAWLSPVSISDPQAKYLVETQQGLALEIATHLAESKYFPRVNLLPGEPRPQELILRFDFDRYQLRRKPHPAYFPAAILTLTLYIWFGGPSHRDEAWFSGSLVAEDTSGRELVRVRDQSQETHSVNFYSNDAIFASGAKARTALVRSLVEKAIIKLQESR